MIQSLAGATIVTPDLDGAIAAYRDFLGYVGDVPSLVGEDLARQWEAPGAASARMAILRPASGERRFIRLVEGAPAEGFRPLKCIGWTAVEIVVQDVDSLAQRLAASPFEVIGAPAVLDFEFTDKIKAMQVVGAGGEILYLTQIDGEIPGFRLPDAKSAVGQLFIMVLATRGLAAAGAFYEALGRPISPQMETRIQILSNAYGLADTYRSRIATIALDDRSLLEIDDFPASAMARPLSSIGLPSGIAMVSVNTQADGGVRIGAAKEWLELLPTGSQP